MNQLLHDICRCTSPTCHVRDLCARFMDSPAGPRTPYADLTNECQDIGAERMFIQHKPKNFERTNLTADDFPYTRR